MYKCSMGLVLSNGGGQRLSKVTNVPNIHTAKGFHFSGQDYQASHYRMSCRIQTVAEACGYTYDKFMSACVTLYKKIDLQAKRRK